MIMNISRTAIVACVAALGVQFSLRADSIDLPAVADTFINDAAPDANAGATAWIDVGTDGPVNGPAGKRRGLIRFSLAGIPSGSTITSAVLRLTVAKTPGQGPADSSMAAYRMHADWVQGTKTGQNGAAATAGEPTWNARAHGSAAWTAPGAADDAQTTASATVAVDSTPGATYAWSGAGMVQDVQLWLDNPAQNFGWLLRSLSEDTERTVRGFASSEAAAGRPVLQIGFTPQTSSSNAAPTVAIISPTNNASFTVPATVNIVIESSDSDGSVTNVQLLNGSSSITNFSASPYSVALSLPPGTHLLSAIAMDNGGLSTTSAPVSITVASQVIPNPITERIPKGNITIELATVVDGMASPLGMAVPDDSSGRAFVYDQDGRVHVVTASGKRAAPLLDLRQRLVLLGAYDERGLLGLAVHPNFAQNPLVYTYTSEPVNGVADFQTGLETNNHQSVITEWRISASDSNSVDTVSAREVLRIDQPQSNHNGGAMHFGPDGFLYVSLGDGGAANDVAAGHVPGGNAQALDRIWGKIIRIDVAGTNSANGQYGIPSSNPFVGQDGLDEIYAYGLRNPFSFSFDRQTGALYVPDVGQNRVEEINIIQSGGNYGWNVKEGTFWFDPSAGAVVTAPVRTPPDGLIDPIAQYDHDDGLAVIAGYVYRGTAIPDLAGRFVFGDWGAFNAPSGRLFYLDATNGINELRIGHDDRLLGQWLKGFGQGPDGELYAFTTRSLGPSGNSGRMIKLVPAPAPITVTATAGGNSTNLNLAWNGGAGPFAIQKKASLGESNWTPMTVTAQRSAAATASGAMGFFRINDAAHVSPLPLSVYLSGKAAGNGTTGTGMGILALDGNTLTFNLHYRGLTGVPSNAHIHGPASTSTSAGVLIGLAPFNGGAWNTNGTLSGVVLLTDEQKALILAGRTYVNIHTPNFGGGEIRGQIVPVNFQTSLSAQGTAAAAGRTGSGNLALVGNQLTFNFTYAGLSGNAVAAHIHGPAAPGGSASPIIDLAPYGAFSTNGSFAGSVTLTDEQLGWVIDGLTYINVHTGANPGGEIRGQIVPNPVGVPFTAALSGLAEKPVALTNSATGTGTFSLEGNRLTFNIAYAGLSGAATAAHIHGPTNAANSAGVLINLAPFNGAGFAAAGTFSGTVELSTAQRNYVLNGLTYVNIHTAANGGGEMRGQIAPILMQASLSGNNERPAAVDTPGTGSGTFALVHDRLTAAVAYSGLLSPATMSHIHGPAGFLASGSVLVGLDAVNTGSYGVSGALNGTVTLPIPALLHVIDGQTYVNFHTTNNPPGEIRGQIMR